MSPISAWEPSELDKQTQIAQQATARVAELEAAANTSICIFCHETMARDLTVMLEHAAECEKRPENRLMAELSALRAQRCEGCRHAEYCHRTLTWQMGTETTDHHVPDYCSLWEAKS